MKKMVITLFVLLSVFSAQLAFAGCWTANVVRASPDNAQFASTTGAFSNIDLSLNTNTTIRNQHLAVLLTAVSSGKQVIMCAASLTRLATITSIYLVQ